MDMHRQIDSGSASHHLSRREWLRRSAVAGLGAGVTLAGAGCADIQKQYKKATGPTAPDWTPLPANGTGIALAVHVLNRAAFGPRPGDVSRVSTIGAAGWIDAWPFE